METRAAENTAIFMCKCCNLFSPSQSELCSHVSEKHAEEGLSMDDIIIPLRPLSTPEPPNPSRAGDELLAVKRKRGRPKGSTKKPCAGAAQPEQVSSTPEEGPPAPEDEGSAGSSSLECSQCGRSFSNARQVRKHICIIVLNLGEEDADAARTSTCSRLGPTQLKIFTCEYCNKVFKFKHSLQAHLRIHTKEKPYACSHCSYASAIKANLNVHLRKHTGEKFSCDHCAFTCLSKGHLKVHVERVHKKIKQHCRFCKKKYSDVKNLIKHMRDAHDSQDRKVQEALDKLCLMTREGKRQLLYDCHICERKFKNELDRDRHMLVHGDQWPFACELCGHGATKYQALELHVRKHPFVYVCALCPKKFVSSVRLRAHLREVHGSAPEATAFHNSINQSFCLLEPGGDVPQEALGDQLQLAEEEVVLQGVNAPKEAACPMDTHPQEAPGEVAVDPGTLGTPVEPASLPAPTLVSPGFLQNSGALAPTETHTVPENPGQPQPAAPAPTQDPGVALSPAGEKGASPPQEPQVTESPLCPGQDTAALGPDDRPGPAEASGQPPPVAGCGDGVPCQPDTCQPASEPSSDITPFMKILNSLQKKPMTTGLCERIRKVYGDLECEYCGKLFWYQVHFDMHVRTHTREHLYYCSQCRYSSITKNCLKRHVIQKHSNVLLTCPTDGCDYCTPDKYKLASHCKLESTLDKRSYSCPVCEKSFSEDRLIKSHIKTSHPEVSLSTISEVLGRRVQLKGLIGKRAMKCPYCDFYFMKNGSDLQRHIWAHEGVKPFKCSVCEYATRSKSNLKAHMNRHSTEKTHLCDMCGKKFKSKGTLKSHKLLHTADAAMPLILSRPFLFFTALHPYQARWQRAVDERKKQQVCVEEVPPEWSLESGLQTRQQGDQRPEKHVPSVEWRAVTEEHARQGGRPRGAAIVRVAAPFRCAHCHYSCNISGSLKRHYNRKHPTEEYSNAGSGELAPDALVQQGGLKCPVCSFVYGTKWEFNRHLKNKHALKLVENEGDPTWEPATEAPEEPPTPYLHITEAEEDVQGTQAAVAALQDLRYTPESGEWPPASHDNRPLDTERVTNEEPSANHTVMIQETLQPSLAEEHHLLLSSDDVEGIETVTVYTQGGEASEFILYMQGAVAHVEETPAESPCPL
ncbi:zinc finger protein ZFAT [Echinops telfairi]|uniref:Zinc finger protein ZFAT n=1 Tax=Echinops telfairi TaxID=9371 RepID=A0AC55CTS8_ECHTE|nr:zinc finger protein ZFAT [Echinops telfairi]